MQQNPNPLENDFDKGELIMGQDRFKFMPVSEFEGVWKQTWTPLKLLGNKQPAWTQGIPEEKVAHIYASGCPLPSDLPPGIPIPSGDLIGGIDIYRHAEPKDGVKFNKDWYAIIRRSNSPQMLLVAGPYKDHEHWCDKLATRLQNVEILGVPPKISADSEVKEKKMLVYFDNCVWRRNFDEPSEKIEAEQKAIQVLFGLRTKGEILIASSEATEAELIPLLKTNKKEEKDKIMKFVNDNCDLRLQTAYNQLGSSKWAVLGFTRLASEEMIELVKKFEEESFEHDDAVHLAIAINSKVDFFVTVDDGIKKQWTNQSNLKIVFPDELVAILNKIPRK